MVHPIRRRPKNIHAEFSRLPISRSPCVIYPSQTGCVQNSSIPVRIFGLSRSSVSSSEHGPSKQRERSPYFDKNVKKWYNKAFKKSKKEIRGVRESWSPWT